MFANKDKTVFETLRTHNYTHLTLLTVTDIVRQIASKRKRLAFLVKPVTARSRIKASISA
jgi:hypothetical protein